MLLRPSTGGLLQTQLVNSLLGLVDLKYKTDGNKELQQSRTEIDKYDLEILSHSSDQR